MFFAEDLAELRLYFLSFYHPTFAGMRRTIFKRLKLISLKSFASGTPRAPVMATITQTVQETVTQNESKYQQPPLLNCPPDCPCKKNSTRKSIRLAFNALGIFIALLATYMIVTTDSNLYIIFWICYSVLRRMMLKSKPHVKTD